MKISANSRWEEIRQSCYHFVGRADEPDGPEYYVLLRLHAVFWITRLLQDMGCRSLHTHWTDGLDNHKDLCFHAGLGGKDLQIFITYFGTVYYLSEKDWDKRGYGDKITQHNPHDLNEAIQYIKKHFAPK